MKILGIDPGSQVTGWGLIEADDDNYEYIDSGIIKIGSKPPMEKRLIKLYQEIKKLLVDQDPDHVVIEDVFVQGKSSIATSTGAKVGKTFGVVLAACSDAEISWLAPKKARKLATGYGGDDKEKTQLNVLAALHLELGELDMPYDESDALALAMAGSRTLAKKP